MKIPKLIEIHAAAEILGVSTARARQLVRGRPFTREIGGRFLIDRAGLVEYHRTRQKTAGRPANK